MKKIWLTAIAKGVLKLCIIDHRYIYIYNIYTYVLYIHTYYIYIHTGFNV